ncbi:MAG: hypothetical protein QM770_20380 [Tepidisphaeraceae bacterium]
MRRAGRYIFNGLTAVSVVGLILLLALWVRSYYVGDYFQWQSFRDDGGDTAYWYQYRLKTGTGFLHVLRIEQQMGGDKLKQLQPALESFEAFSNRWSAEKPPFDPRDDLISGRGVLSDFVYERRALSQSSHLPPAEQVRLLLPMWALALPLIVFPATSVVGLWRRRRMSHAGLCPACGYDLRASPQRCPECGREVVDNRTS